MINRSNWQLTLRYLAYRKEVDLIADNSLRAEETHLRFMLKWLDAKNLLDASKIRPTFPNYLTTKAQENREKPYTEQYVKKVLATCRNFIEWVVANSKGYKSLLPWINTLKTKRIPDIPKTREYVTLEEILVIANSPCMNTQERRTRAMAVFLYLSGMRIDAFVSMPLIAVDIDQLEVMQYPVLGVRTKNRKSAKTFLLPIPELLEVIKEWDKEVRYIVPENGYWFAPLHPRTGEIDPKNLDCPPNRKSVATRNLKEWLIKLGLPYHSPHKFRHGHVHYGNERAITQADRKAVSMNVMHANVGITDTYYSNHSENDLKNSITQLTKGDEKPDFDMDEYREFQAFKRWKSTQ